ncbi:MAG: DUF799 family lipoprotein [Desulfobacteraceae bacterium]|jgi:hypothetical protein|nr:DUF799 family lipoprotein [Desulfobacteraceae bacterium]
MIVKKAFPTGVKVTVNRIFIFLWCVAFLFLCGTESALAGEKQDEEYWEVHPDYAKYTPDVIAVLPMDNLTLEPELETFLYDSVYEQLQTKGYRRISVDKVRKVMDDLGVQTSGQLQGFSMKRLSEELNADAVFMGQVDQSASIHEGVYDAIVVSCSLRLIDCKTGTVLWKSEQWRTAHRQWQLDPFNALLNLAAHAGANRSARIAWLVQEMLKTLPEGKVELDFDNLLDQAVKIQIKE